MATKLMLICHYEKLYLSMIETAHLKQQDHTYVVACMCIYLSEFCPYPIGHKGGQLL